MSAVVTERLHHAVAEGRAAPLELALADWALRHGSNNAVAAALAACARAVADGHSCLSLAEAGPALPGEQPFCSVDELKNALADSALAGAPGDSRPLILEQDRLYLQRYWQYEQRLAAALAQRLALAPEPVSMDALLPAGGLFDEPGDGQTQWQAVAAFAALRHRFAVISGGPGTGKTFTVLRLMRLLIETALDAGAPPPLIRLAAPTGKAAARMLQSTRSGLEAMVEMPDAVRAHIPKEAQTLHRLIGLGGRNRRPRYNPDHPLAADAVIVDEASMVDLPMMAKLVEALPADARLILLGDRYQLASVESGSVLSELCNAAGVNAFTQAQRDEAKPLLRQAMTTGTSALADHVVTLQTSHRFAADSRIGQLAAAVNAGDVDVALAQAASGSADIEWWDQADQQALAQLVRLTADQFGTLMHCQTAADALPQLRSLALLCALRHGPTGAMTCNQRVATEIKRRHGIDLAATWHHGRPVMITRNDYRLGLFNGDAGVALRDQDDNLRVWFETDGGLRSFLPSSLPEHDPMYAMTVHKSQGSEFDRVILLLPPEDARILTRELLYTGITRARTQVTLIGSQQVLRSAIRRGIERHSGLARRILGPDKG